MFDQGTLESLGPRTVKKAAAKTYYAMKTKDFLKLKADHGINYIVMNKSVMKKKPRLRLAYQNERYILFKL